MLAQLPTDNAYAHGGVALLRGETTGGREMGSSWIRQRVESSRRVPNIFRWRAMSREPRTDEQIALSDLFYGVTMKKIQAVAMILAVSVLSGAVSSAEIETMDGYALVRRTESEAATG